MKRRSFLIAAGLAATLSGQVHADPTDSEYDGKSANQSAKARLRLSSQAPLIPGKTIAEKAAFCKKCGIEALELNYGTYRDTRQARKELDDAGLVPSILHGVGPCGLICSDDTSQHAKGIETIQRAIEAAHLLGGLGFLLVPAFHGTTKLSHQEIRKALLDTLPPLAQMAGEAGTSIIFEPLNRGENSFLRLVSDGAALARDIAEQCTGAGKNGIKTMGDFYHMAIEETDMMGAFISGGKYLQHVHLAGGPSDPRRTLPGQNATRFVEGFRGLKYIGYDKFCSFECGVKGDKEIEIPKACAFLRREWELAEI
ncbi:MAG: sugar phosphate isomerase/epimerase family protein [Planctomycetia bacterium]|nr:sugar phosphate isomerase/epimerase family protein [Planctomycetia bacterium]